MSPFRQPPRASTSKETLDSQSPRRSDADQSDSLANSWNSISMQNSAGPGEAPWCPSLTNMDAIGIALDEGSLEGAIPLDYATQPFFGTEVPEFATPTAGSSRVGEAAVQVQHPGQIGLDWQSPSGPQFIDPRALHDDPSFFPTALSTSAGSSSRHSTPTPHPRTPTPPPTHPPPATSAPTPPQPARGRSGRVLQDVDRVNRPVAGPSRSRQIASRVQPKRAAKRPCEEHENLPATIPADGVTKRLRTKGPAVESAQASSSKATTSQPARKRRKQAELEALQVVPNTRCGLDGCDVRLPVDLAAARRHMWTHYGVPQPDVEAGSQPGGSTKGKQVMRSTDPKAKYVCKYRSVKGQCCTDDGGKPKALSGGQALERHVQGKHYGWKYVCEGCGSTFPRRDAPKRHEKTKHREHAREDGEPPSGDPDSDAESEPEPESDPE